MSREGVKPACCQKACCDWKDMLQDLYEKTINSYRILNGLYPDGTGELRITAGDGIIIDTLSGNEVRISADELAGYSAISPIQLDTDLNTISIAIDDGPTLNSTNAVRSGGTYAAIRARGSSTDPVEEATHATNADHQTAADSQTTAGSATNANHQTTADSATNADHQTAADSQTTAGSATNANHQTTADSQTTAGSATTASSQISAGEAAKLSTARTMQTNLASGTAVSFDGSADVTPGVTGILPIQNGGTGQSSVDTVPTSGSQKMVTSDGVFSMTNTHQNSTLINQLTPSGDVKIASITVPKNGFYLALGCLRFRDVLSVGNMISLGFSVNSGAIEYISTSTMGPNTYGRITGHYCISLNAGDTIYLTCGQVFQSQIYVDAFLDVIYLAGA